MQLMKMNLSPMLKDYIAMKHEEGIKEGVKKGKAEGIKVIECTGLSKEKILLLQKGLDE